MKYSDYQRTSEPYDLKGDKAPYESDDIIDIFLYWADHLMFDNTQCDVRSGSETSADNIMDEGEIAAVRGSWEMITSWKHFYMEDRSGKDNGKWEWKMITTLFNKGREVDSKTSSTLRGLRGDLYSLFDGSETYTGSVFGEDDFEYDYNGYPIDDEEPLSYYDYDLYTSNLDIYKRKFITKKPHSYFKNDEQIQQMIRDYQSEGNYKILELEKGYAKLDLGWHKVIECVWDDKDLYMETDLGDVRDVRGFKRLINNQTGKY